MAVTCLEKSTLTTCAKDLKGKAFTSTQKGSFRACQLGLRASERHLEAEKAGERLLSG